MPDDPNTMELGPGKDLVFRDGRREPRYELTFVCSDPKGALCWIDGEVYAHLTNKDFPWPRQPSIAPDLDRLP